MKARFSEEYPNYLETTVSDKNGKLIIQGHLLKGSMANGDYRKNKKYRETLFCMSFDDRNGFHLYDFPFEDNKGDYRWFPYPSQCEIVGHITTDSNLIPEKTDYQRNCKKYILEREMF